MNTARTILIVTACFALISGAVEAKTREELMKEIDTQNLTAQQKLHAGEAKPKPIPTPAPKPKATPTPDDTDSDTDSNGTTQNKKEGSTKSNSDADPYASQRWTETDVQKLCARQTSGPRAYDSCVSRNERRVGREKGPYDDNMINQ